MADLGREHNVAMRNHRGDPNEIVGRWRYLGGPTVRLVKTKALRYASLPRGSDGRVELEFSIDYEPLDEGGRPIRMGVSGRWLHFHLPGPKGSNAGVEHHRTPI
jgi:hypothetical protein